MTRTRGAPKGRVPDLRRTGRDRRRREVYVYVEGMTEHDYLRYLNSRFGDDFGFHLNVVADPDKGMTPRRALDAAEIRARELRDEQPRTARVRGDNQPVPGKTYLPIWVFFDHDKRPRDELVRAHDRAMRCGINVAFSHPCFELWLYLHLANSPGPQVGGKNQLRDRLRRSHTAYLDYDSGGSKRLESAQLAALAGKEGIAAQRARALVAQCDTGRCDHRSHKCRPVDRDPSTGVYLLLEALGIVPL